MWYTAKILIKGEYHLLGEDLKKPIMAENKEDAIEQMLQKHEDILGMEYPDIPFYVSAREFNIEGISIDYQDYIVEETNKGYWDVVLPFEVETTIEFNEEDVEDFGGMEEIESDLEEEENFTITYKNTKITDWGIQSVEIE